MKKTVTSITFSWQCEEAFKHYQSVLGGEFARVTRYSELPSSPDMPPLASEKADKMMHIELILDGEMLLMWADDIGLSGKQRVMWNRMEVALLLNCSKPEADKIYAWLSAGWEVTMPIADQFRWDYYGMCVDKYWIAWMINCAPTA